MERQREGAGQAMPIIRGVGTPQDPSPGVQEVWDQGARSGVNAAP